MLKVYVDAATQQKTGKSGVGLLIVGENLHLQLHFPVGVMNNHQAEFMAVILALRELKKRAMTDEFIVIHSDSKTVLDVIKQGKTSNPDYQSYWQKLTFLLPHFETISFEWTPDSVHQGAHQLAQLGLKEAESRT